MQWLLFWMTVASVGSMSVHIYLLDHSVAFDSFGCYSSGSPLKVRTGIISLMVVPLFLVYDYELLHLFECSYF